MEILDVVRVTPEVLPIAAELSIRFKIVGAEIPFHFPFENGSLQNKKIIFVKKKEG